MILKLLGAFISDGFTSIDATHRRLEFSFYKDRKHQFIIDAVNGTCLQNLTTRYDRRIYINLRNHPVLLALFNSLSVGASNKYIPDFVWLLGQANCDILLKSLVQGDGHTFKCGHMVYHSTSIRLLNDIQRLALHCGYSATIKLKELAGSQNIIGDKIATRNYDYYMISIIEKMNEPQINYSGFREIEEFIDCKGKVYCIEVPDTHLFYCRESFSDPPMWDGNSARSGQKGQIEASVLW